MTRPGRCFFLADTMKAPLGHFGSMILVSPQKPHSWGWGQLFHALKIKPTSSAWPAGPSLLLPAPGSSNSRPRGSPRAPRSSLAPFQVAYLPETVFPSPCSLPKSCPPSSFYLFFSFLYFELRKHDDRTLGKYRSKLQNSFTIYYNYFLSR